jgi:hypothetical protein
MHKVSSSLVTMDMLRSDLRVPCRQMLKAPAFAATVTVVLPAGFVVSSSIFSVVGNVLSVFFHTRNPSGWFRLSAVAREPSRRPGMVESIAVARMQLPPEKRLHRNRSLTFQLVHRTLCKSQVFGLGME